MGLTVATLGRDPGTTFSVIKVGPGGATPLADDANKLVVRTVAETHLHLPGMFEITFNDDSGNVVSTAGLSIGAEVKIFGPAGKNGTPKLLVDGEVTSIEGMFERLNFITVVRGYDKAHRLQRALRTRTFLNMSDSEIADQIAQEAGLTPGQIDSSSTTHIHLGQCNQTDWNFLSQRAREIGFETGVADGKFYFRKASTVAGTEEPVSMTFRQDMRSFRPRLTAGNLPSEVEVRVWDPAQATVIASQTATAASNASLTGYQPATIAGTFASAGAAEAEGAEGVEEAETEEETGNLGPPPATDAYVINDRPAASGSAITAAATQIAAGLADHIGSTFAEAEGEAVGNPAIQAGAAINVSNVAEPFAGTWLVTRARHIFDLREGGYRTLFEASGRQDRSLLGLASAPTVRPAPPQMPGLACAVVTNNNDPTQKGKVKVVLPWLSPDYESDWAPVVQFGAGKRSGAMFLPEVGDEVLIGFELADPRRPYVLGGIVHDATTYSLGGDAVQATGMAGEVVRRGFVSAAGNLLVFHDEMPPGDSEGPATASDMTLGTGDGSLCLAIDQTAGTITLTCKPAPPGSQAPMGQLTIECGDAGTINIKTGPGGSVNIDGGGTLSLKAEESISIQSSGQVAIKGAQIMLN